MNTGQFDVIIVGGSYAGLSAGMALGRSLRKVLIIDSGKPCNRQTPHSHNFITHDGEPPAVIAEAAKAQVLQYDTVQFYSGLVTAASRTGNGFTVNTSNNETFTAKKLIFTTGIADELPAIEGLAECWGISVLHCPYCHGYEVKHENLGIISNGDLAFEFGRLINNWSKTLTLFTNGPSTLNEEQTRKLQSHNITIVEKEIVAVEHQKGMIEQIVFRDGSRQAITALFTKPGLKQHCDIPQQLGCELNDHGLIKVDELKKTTVPGIYAAGDNSMLFRAVSMAVAAGTMAGAAANKELIDESF